MEIGWITFRIPKGVLILFAQFGPSLAGLFVIYIERGKQGIFSVLKSLTRLKLPLKWFIFALFFELALFHLIILYCAISGYGNINIIPSYLFQSYLNFLINAASLTLLTGLGEEIGWRGLLLPRLQAKYRIIIAAIILSLINSLWHFQSDCMTLILKADFAGFSAIYFPDMMIRILITIPVVFIIIYLFNKTRGSLLIMIFYHGSANASYEWAKEITGNNDPFFLLHVFVVFLWITMTFFIPAIIKQERNNELVTRIG
jgi:membrane protease YdiL (CAAX protease family)